MMKGFTLIEMLLTLAVIALLAGVSAPIFMSFQARNDLNVASSVVLSSLRRAQTLARAMENDKSWGVYMEDLQLTIFSGTDYASRDVNYDEIFVIAPTVSFAGITEVVFDRFTGETSDVGNIIINSNNNDSRTITINKKGMLQY